MTALGDCTSLLWRLEMLKNPLLHPAMPMSALPPPAAALPAQGAGGRWRELAARWKPYLPSLNTATTPSAEWWPSAGVRASGGERLTRWYSWNDVHAVMALAMASAREGDEVAGAQCEALLQDMAVTAAQGGGGGAGGAGGAAAGDVAWLSATLAAMETARPPALFAALGGSGGGKGGGRGSASSQRCSDAPSEQARVTALVGLDTALGCAAFARGEWAVAATHLSAASPHWQALGGSHVQRDVFEATLLDAQCACAGGGSSSSSSGAGDFRGASAAAARMLASARVTLRPGSPQRWWSLGAALTASGGEYAQGAQGAKNRAHALGLNQGPGY